MIRGGSWHFFPSRLYLQILKTELRVWLARTCDVALNCVQGFSKWLQPGQHYRQICDWCFVSRAF